MQGETVHRNPFEVGELASAYDSWFDTPLGRAVGRLQSATVYRLARPHAGELALDVGTGTGLYACNLANRGLHVVGCDSSEAMLQVARAKATRVVWQLAEAESLPFSEGTFDLVLSVTALEFMRDPAQALSEMFRVVSPGGRLVLGVLNAQSAWGKDYIRDARRDDTPFRYACLYTPATFETALGAFGPVRWSGSVFFAPSGRGLRLANVLEYLGKAFCRGHGSLLVGRVDK